MKSLILFCGLIALMPANAQGDKKLYPDVIRELKDKSSAEIEEALGAPDMQDTNQYHYAVGNYRYALHIKFTDGTVSYIRYVLQEEERPSLEEMIETGIFALSDVSKYPAEGHAKGRYLRSKSSKNPDSTYQFFNNEQKALHSFIWHKTKEKPCVSTPLITFN